MERIRTIEQLRLQKELLQTQQMIAELRMKRDIHLIKRKIGISGLVMPAVKQLFKTGVKTKVGKELLFSTAGMLAKKLFKKKSR
jgi:hypothetical protein